MRSPEVVLQLRMAFEDLAFKALGDGAAPTDDRKINGDFVVNTDARYLNASGFRGFLRTREQWGRALCNEWYREAVSGGYLLSEDPIKFRYDFIDKKVRTPRGGGIKEMEWTWGGCYYAQN
jgi:hypothetical protein